MFVTADGLKPPNAKPAVEVPAPPAKERVPFKTLLAVQEEPSYEEDAVFEAPPGPPPILTAAV